MIYKSYRQISNSINKLKAIVSDYEEKVKDKKDDEFMLGFYWLKTSKAIDALYLAKVELEVGFDGQTTFDDIT